MFNFYSSFFKVHCISCVKLNFINMLKIVLSLTFYVLCFVAVTETSRKLGRTKTGNNRNGNNIDNNNNNNTPPVDCSTGFYIKKNPSSCTSFYTCSNGVPHLQSCAPGTKYSETTHNCVHPHESDCEIGSEQGSSSNRPSGSSARPSGGRQDGQGGGKDNNNSSSSTSNNNNSGSNDNNSSQNEFFYDMIFVKF